MYQYNPILEWTTIELAALPVTGTLAGTGIGTLAGDITGRIKSKEIEDENERKDFIKNYRKKGAKYGAISGATIGALTPFTLSGYHNFKDKKLVSNLKKIKNELIQAIDENDPVKIKTIIRRHHKLFKAPTYQEYLNSENSRDYNFKNLKGLLSKLDKYKDAHIVI